MIGGADIHHDFWNNHPQGICMVTVILPVSMPSLDVTVIVWSCQSGFWELRTAEYAHRQVFSLGLINKLLVVCETKLNHQWVARHLDKTSPPGMWLHSLQGFTIPSWCDWHVQLLLLLLLINSKAQLVWCIPPPTVWECVSSCYIFSSIFFLPIKHVQP